MVSRADFPKFKRALDAMPDGMTPTSTEPSGREAEAVKALKGLKGDIEVLMEKLDLSDEVCNALFQILNKYEARSSKDVGPNAVKGKDAAKHRRARDEEELDHHERLRRFFRGKGLDEEGVERAMELVLSEEKAKDRLPENGLHGGYGGHLRSEDDTADFERRFPEDVTGTLTPGNASASCSPACTLGGSFVLDNTTATISSVDITVTGSCRALALSRRLFPKHSRLTAQH